MANGQSLHRVRLSHRTIFAGTAASPLGGLEIHGRALERIHRHAVSAVVVVCVVSVWDGLTMGNAAPHGKRVQKTVLDR